MDEFLRNIHTIVFRQWILNQNKENFQVFNSQDDADVVIIETELSHSEITFNPMNIIELCVINKINDRPEFYLHFQMKTIKHAMQLYYEMKECIDKISSKRIVKILLSCTGGLTTGYFAEKLNDAAKLLQLDYEFSAVAYSHLYKIGQNYDVILLAPQISYMHVKVQDILSNNIVLQIPSQVFAKYDAGRVIALIQNKLKYREEKETQIYEPLSMKQAVHTNMKILVIAMIRNTEKVQLVYRLYDEKNNILIDSVIIKTHISLEDMYDIIDTVLAQYADIKIVGLSMPGIINEGHIQSPNDGFENLDIIGRLSAKYPLQFYLHNDVNCVAVGYYTSQNKYQSLSFLFQPITAGAGVGNICHGRLIAGKKNIAGEVQYFPLDLSDDRMTLAHTPEGTLELVSKICLALMSVIGPEAIVMFCQLIPDVDELKREMEKFIPRDYIPDIIKVDFLTDYILLGEMILAIQSYREER